MIVLNDMKVHVVAGVIRGAGDTVLISLRPSHTDQGGLWEFPGGKREVGESRRAALVRELHEELNIEVKGAVPLLRLVHEYPEKTVDLDVWDVFDWEGNERGAEGQHIAWVACEDLREYRFPAANTMVVEAARLPRVVITLPPSIDSDGAFAEQLKRWISSGIRCFLSAPARLADSRQRVLPPALSKAISRDGATVLYVSDYLSSVDTSRHLQPETYSDGTEKPTCAVKPRTVYVAVAGDATNKESSQGISLIDVTRGWSNAAHLVRGIERPVFAFGPLSPEDIIHAVVAGCQGIILGAEYWLSDPLSLMQTIQRDLGALAESPNRFDDVF